MDGSFTGMLYGSVAWLRGFFLVCLCVGDLMVAFGLRGGL